MTSDDPFEQTFLDETSVRILEHNLLKVTQVGLFLPCRIFWKQFH